MAITHTIVIGEKRKSKFKKWDEFTPEEKEAYFEKKKLEMAKAKLDFVNSIIDYAKSKEHFPWEEPNFVHFPKSWAKLHTIEEYNKKHQDNPKPRSEAKYAGMNLIKLCKEMTEREYQDSRWITKFQAVKLGGKLKEAEPATYIWVVKPEGRIKKVFNTQTNKREIVYKRDEKTGEFLLDKKGKKIPEKEPVWKLSPVYNVEQFEGLNLEPEPPLKELSDTNTCPEMESIIAHSEAPVIHDQYSGNGRYYAPYKDEIHLPPVKNFKSMSAYYATAAHEIGHSTGHPKRLNRDMGGTFGSKSYAREELVAELTALFLSQELEIKIPQKEMDNHAEYIRGWDTKVKALMEKPDELVKIISDAQKATNYIKEHMLVKTLNQEQTVDKGIKLPKTEETKSKEAAPVIVVKRNPSGKDMER